MKSFARADRIAAQLRRDVGELVHGAVRDHRLPSLSVSDVEVSRDYEHARVFVTALLADQGPEGVKALNDLAPGIRHDLGKRLRMRHTPELKFFYDDSIDRGARIDELLRQGAAGQGEEE